jgi:hypothetical protein
MNRRTFLKSSAALAVAAALPALAFAATKNTLLSDIGCGRATGYAEANKIITHDGKTHVAWIDSPPEGFRIRVRTLDHASNEWSPMYTIGEGYDNHGGPALTIDSKGYLHIAYYPHHHPMRYRKSLRPNDASEWGAEEQVGERTTYPTLVCGPDDTLYLTCRVSSREVPWETQLFTKPADGAWSEPRTILQSEHMAYSHFMEALAWGPDHKTLHLATRIYSGEGRTGHTIGYMKSEDFGQTWTKRDGSPIEMPATASTVDVVATASDDAETGLRAGAMAVSPDNKPYILCSDYDARPCEAWIAFPGEDGAWQRRMLRQFLPDEYKDWGLATTGGITFNEGGDLHVVLTGYKDVAPGASLWGHAAAEIVGFVSKDNGKTFSAEFLTTPDEDTPRWLPNMERPTGHNRVKGNPGIIYTEGGAGEKNTELLANNVYRVTR